ncbi:acyl carrier protein [Paraburkholderia aspalathi]|uniref:acyl carrier protein n=1 Tax=Paraburkholderia aspalathi TaxID=1324617 RepID=UPI0038BDD4BB
MDKDQQEIRQWLVGQIADSLHVSRDVVPTDAPVVDLGLSSVEAVSLTANIEEFLGIETDPAMVWEHPTIDQMVEHLCAGPSTA